MRSLRRAIGGVCLGLALSGCLETYPDYPVAPTLLSERVPEPPATGTPQSWRPGYYDYQDGQYRWVPGEWVPLAGHGRLWQDGYWVRTGSKSYSWVPAGWSDSPRR